MKSQIATVALVFAVHAYGQYSAQAPAPSVKDLILAEIDNIDQQNDATEKALQNSQSFDTVRLPHLLTAAFLAFVASFAHQNPEHCRLPGLAWQVLRDHRLHAQRAGGGRHTGR